MTHSTGVSKQFSILTVVCVCALLLTWAAPLLLSGGGLEFSQRGQSRQTDTLTDGLSEIEDASDDPVAITAGSQPGHLPLTFALHTDPLFDRAWSPTTLMRPPNSLIAI